MSEEETKEVRKVLTIQDIVEAAGTVERQVPIPALGGDVVIRNLTNREVKQIYERSTDRKGKVDQDRVEEMMICWGSVNPKITPDTYRVLLDKNAGAVAQYIAAILEVSELSQGAMDDARAAFRG